MKQQPERRSLKGQLLWSDGRDVSISVVFDKIALSGNGDYLAFISCVGYANDIKAMRAALAVGETSAMRLSAAGYKPLQLRKGGEVEVVDSARCLTGRKYSCWAHRLGCNTVHAIFTARYPGLMLEDTDNALWQQLKDPRYTTPMLRSWLPYLRRELAESRNLVPAACLDCQVVGLTATTSDLDRIVEHGLQNGEITIHEEDAA